MTQQEVQDKRDAIDLLEGISHEGTRQAILRTFEGRLSEYVGELLNPEMDDATALHVRAKAIGLIEVMTEIGGKVSKIADLVPIQRAAHKITRQAMYL